MSQTMGNAPICAISLQPQDIKPMRVESWATVCDDGPTFNQHRFIVSCLQRWHLMLLEAGYIINNVAGLCRGEAGCCSGWMGLRDQSNCAVS